MDLHEYQSKNILEEHGIFLSKRKLCTSLEGAYNFLETFCYPCMVKAQIHSGARGKAGLIKKIFNKNEAFDYCKFLFGKLATTSQVNEPKIINKILIEECVDIKKELYLSLVINRNTSKINLIFSLNGGIEIENNKDFYIQEIDPEVGIYSFQIKELIFENLKDIEKNVYYELFNIIKRSVDIFVKYNASLLEINPLVISEHNRVIPLDAKISLDDNYVEIAEDLKSLRDFTQENELEVLAKKHDLNYINFEGDIGCMVNGAGLAMATMDIISSIGKTPANFLDVGGNCSKSKVLEAFKIINLNKNIKLILINIFGGIVKCDLVAEGLIEACKFLDFKIPIIVRLEGTNKEKANEILNNSGFNFIIANNFIEISNKLSKI